MSDQPAACARQDLFLATSDAGQALRDVIIAATWAEYSKAVGQGRPADWLLFGRMSNPRIGDLVIELTRACWSPDPQLRRIGFGYLVHAEAGDYQVQYGQQPESICDWSNCQLIAVLPETIEMFMAGGGRDAEPDGATR